MQARKRSIRALAGFTALTAGFWSASAMAQLNSVYTDAQATAGRDLYNQNCAACHMRNLSGEGEAVQLAGADFMGSWGNRSAGDLFNEIKLSMPLGHPDSLGDDGYASIVAYILQANGAPSGAAPFAPDSGVIINKVATGIVPADIANAKPAVAEAQPAAAPGGPRGPGGGPGGGRGGPGGPGGPGGGGGRRAAPAAPKTGITVAGTVKSYTPITEAMMTNPSASDWLMHYHNYAGWDFSPLSQINTKNVGKLALKWVWPMDEGGYQQITPLVHDGVMFLSNNATNKVQALNAKTGDLIWENVVGGASLGATNGTRTMALYGDKLFYPATDGKLYAMDAKTGKVDWVTNTHVGAAGVIGGIITAHDKVFVGTHGCGAGSIEEQCFLAAYDVNTGKQIWKFLTTAATGGPDGDTWSGMPDNQRTGNSIWTAPTYDSKLNLIYFGTGQNKVRGVTGDAAYALSTIALDADTGKLKWHFTAGSDFGLDLDEAFEKTLIDEGNQKVLVTTGKKGIMWKLDRVTGKYLGNRETVYQNVFTSIDPQTGHGTYRPDIFAQTPGAQTVSCPTSEGGHNWQSSSYVPAHDLIIIPLSQSCSIGNSLYEMPGTDGNMGRVSAYEVKTLRPVWTFQQRSPFLSSVMTTGGDVGFVGDWDRTVRAFDVKTGKTLWKARLGTTPQGYITTYSVDGQQFVVVPTGYNGGSPEQKPGTMLGGSIVRPTTGQAVYVFALPKP